MFAGEQRRVSIAGYSGADERGMVVAHYRDDFNQVGRNAMKRSSMTMAALGLVLAASACAAADVPPAQVEVTFVQPEKFTDAGNDPSGYRRDENLGQLKRYLVQRATVYPAAGQVLSISVTDVDLAGGFEPLGSTMEPVRVIRGAYPPKVDLSFRLTDAAGKVLKEGTRHLTDLAFDRKARSTDTNALAYDKALLDGWLQAEFGKK